MNSGWVEGDEGTTNSNLRWMKDHEEFWSAEWLPDVWHNIAYEVVSSSPFSDPASSAYIRFAACRGGVVST